MYVTFVLLLFVHYLSFFWCLGKAVHSWLKNTWVRVSVLIFLHVPSPIKFNPGPALPLQTITKTSLFKYIENFTSKN